ncbi:MFS family permease [Arthrobacter pigmenti]|uniref:MFS family permease n=1 Tax=Arthrobacter pigmenti TaxID=271432 RepID=A0A846REU4_9MICC|nr:MFS transporter [Arthrobacter pigmenti]NJC21668.1 MFS family permease [Arthrobacter pigmenti]
MSADVQPHADVATNREILRIPAFRRLGLAWIFSNFGDSALYLTAAIWVKQLTGSDAAAGLVFAALGLPALLAPLTGQLADRFRRVPVLAVTNVAAAVVVLALLLVRSADHLWLIYVVIFVYANASYVTAAAQSGVLRDLLPDRMLAPANGMLSSIDQGLRIVSPLIGAGILGLWGMDWVVGMTCVSFLVAAAVLSRLRVAESVHERGQESFWATSTAGFRFLFAHALLRPALLTLVIAVGATGVLNVTIFATTEQGLGMPPEFLSVLISCQGVMSVVGGLTASMVIRRLGIRRTIVVGILLLSVAVFGSGVPVLGVVLGSTVLLGIGVPWAIIAFVTLRQQETPPAMQGRTSAATNMMINVPQVGASVLAAALLSIIDYRMLILAMTVLCFLSVLPLVLRRRSAAVNRAM